MARLFEHQGKTLLDRAGIPIPRGRVAASPEQAGAAARELGGAVAIKAQSWSTGRAGMGGVRFADSPDQAAIAAGEILGMNLKGFPVEQVLVEEKLDISREFFAAVLIDDTTGTPMVIFSSVGGSGIEEIAARHPDQVARQNLDVLEGLRDFQARDLVRRTGISGNLQRQLAEVLVKLYRVCRSHEARSAEINPLVLTTNEKVVAADCHIAIDDYAVFRHQELGIEIARELSNPPTPLDRIAFNVEKGDYRGTFYFFQLVSRFGPGEGYIGFHGAGGGGSMMSMDAVLAEGYKIANFCDTSGNPPASKVYRAARIIMAQGPIDAYFGSGSGVASQEQFHSARGLVKAFREARINVPVVVRLGGNQEEKAMDILTGYSDMLHTPIECYGKQSPAAECARRLKELETAHRAGMRPADPGVGLDAFGREQARARYRRQTEAGMWDSAGKGCEIAPAAAKPIPPLDGGSHRPAYEFSTVTGGTVSFDYSRCDQCQDKVCITDCQPGILKLDDGRPVLNITPQEAAKGKCTECLACEVECARRGNGGGRVLLPIPGLDDYLAATGRA